MTNKFLHTLLVILLLTAPAISDWIPSGLNSWNDDKERVTDIGLSPRNYQKVNGDWEKIDTTWQSVGDTLFICRKAVVAVKAWPNGTSEIGVNLKNHTVTLRQSLHRLVFVDTVTWNHRTIFNDWEWPAPAMNGRDLSWSLPGLKFRIRKEFGRTAHQIVFRPAALDSICTLFDDLSPAAQNRAALGVVFKYDVTGLNDAVLSNHSRVSKKQLRKFGRRLFSISSHRLHFPGSDTLRDIPVYQEWEKIGDSFYLCEYLMMSQLDSLHTAFPNMAVWHGATAEVEDIYLEDTYVEKPANPGYNYGGAEEIHVASALTWLTDTIGLVRCVDVATALGAGATMTSCSLVVPITAVADAGTISMYRLFKYFAEGTETGNLPDPDSGAVWSHWQGLKFRVSGIHGYHWTADDALVTGPNCADDDGVDNSVDGGTCVAARADVTATAMSSHTVDTTGWYKFEVTTSLAQGWYDGDAAENGVMLKAGVLTSIEFNASEKSGAANSPISKAYFRFHYTIGGGQVIIVN